VWLLYRGYGAFHSKILKETNKKEEMNIMNKKSDRIINITSVLLALLLLGIAAGPASAGANLISNLSAVNQTSIAVYQPITGDHVNETYINKHNVTLNITIQLEAANINGSTTDVANNNIQLDNLTINFGGTGIILPNTSVNTLRLNESNFLATTFVNNAADTGFNLTDTNMTINNGIISFNRSSWARNGTFGINDSVNGANFLHVNISNVIMPSTSSSPYNISISVSAYNGSIGVGSNTTYVFLRVNPDTTAPTIPSANVTFNNLISGISVFDSSSRIVNVTGNVTAIPIQFYMNDTGTSTINASGINITSINVVIDAGTASEKQLMVNGTINTGAITTDTRNASVSLGISNWAGFGNLTAGNTTTGTSHTLTIAVKDNSSNAATNYTKTFYVPRLILGANKTSDVTADNAQLVLINATLLAPDGSKSRITSNVQFSSDAGVTFNPSTVSLDGLGNASTLVKFSTAGTHTIHALVDNAQQDLAITTVAAVTSAKMGIKSDMGVTSASIVANGSDTTILTVQAVDANGNAVARSGRNVTVWETNGAAISVSTLTGITTANGQFNVTLTSNTTSGVSLTFNAQIEADNGSVFTAQNTVSVNFISGPVRTLSVNTSVNGSSSAATSFVGLGTVSPGTNATIDNLVAGNTTIISVNLTDDAAHIISGETVNFALTGAGSLSSTSAMTNSTGTAWVTFTSGTTAANLTSIINITTASNATLYTNVRVNTTYGSAHYIVMSANRTGLATGTSAMLNASIKDINNNPVNVSNVNVSFIITSGLGTLNRSSALTDSTGTANVIYTAGSSAGTTVVEANSTTLNLPGSLGNKTSISLTIGTPDGFTLGVNKSIMSTTDNASRGSPIIATVQLTSAGSPIGSSGVNMTFQITSGSLFDPNSLTVNNGSSMTVQTNSTGIAQVQINGSGIVEVVTLIVTDIDNPLISAQTKQITFTGAAASFTLTNTTISEPNTLGIRSTNVTVQLKDSANNDVGQASVVSFTASAGNLSAYTGTTNASTGQLTVTLTANTTDSAVSSLISAFISGLTSQSLTVNLPRILDTVAPVVTITTPVNGSTINTSTVTVSGTATDNFGVTSLTVNGNAVTVTSGSFSTTVTLVTGSNTITVVASDAAGNSATATVTVTATDTTAPVVTIIEPVNGSTVNTSTVTVSGTATDDVGVTSLTVNGASVTLTNGSFSTTVTLVTGTNTITVVASDAAGNSATATVTVTAADTTAPVVTITEPVNGSTVNTSTVTVSGTATDDVGVTSLTMNGASVTLTNGSFSTTVTLVNGSNTITVVATDAAGNIKTETVTVIFTAPQDILAYYRALTGSPTVVDTADLLMAANDWSNGVIPTGFTESITTQQLLALANEWSSS